MNILATFIKKFFAKRKAAQFKKAEKCISDFGFSICQIIRVGRSDYIVDKNGSYHKISRAK